MSEMERNTAVKASEAAEEPKDFERDGMLYCGKCGRQRQRRVSWGGGEMMISCRCKCEQEEYERKQEERAFVEETEKNWGMTAEEQRIQKIGQLRARGLDRAYWWWTFEADDRREPKMAYLRRYAEKWDEVRKKGVGLLLWGDVGTGKTYGAASVVNALTDRGVPCMMTTFIRLANELSGGARDRKNEYIDSLNSYPLLVIDDLGAERSSEYMQEMVFEVIDARYRTGRPLIVTTNLTLEYLRNPEKVTYSRIYDRILEMTVPIKFTEKRRGLLHEAKREALMSLLRGGA